MSAWVGIAGPTASGKSAAAMALANALPRPVEIVSVDSALVYRGMDIGSAKPSREERAQVPHHLIDILDPRESYSAAAFVADTRRLIAEITARGALPLLVGGTMLYFKALVGGLDEMPASDPALRAALDAEAAERGWPALHAALAQVDPATAARLPPHDAQRIQRALEVHRLTGRPLSSFHTQRNAPDINPMPCLIALEPQDRAWLHARIAQRFVQMLELGLIDEVRALRARGDLHATLPAMRCVGYRQVWQALDDAPSDEAPLNAAAMKALTERGTAATRQLAKRQLTWLRSMPWRQVVACDGPDALSRVVQIARQDLAR